MRHAPTSRDWNRRALAPPRAPGTRIIPVVAPTRAEAIQRAKALPWWPRVVGIATIATARGWLFEVRS